MILVINCGSSSVKYSLFDVEKEVSLCKGGIERIGGTSSIFIHECEDKEDALKIRDEIICQNHHRAMEIIGQVLIDPEKGVLSDLSVVKGVGHRVVHGGEEFNESIRIDDEVLKSIEKFSELAPLHNPPSLEGIKGCIEIFKNIPQIAVFDTAFHQSMEEHVFFYGIPYELYEKYGIRKYGFHGTSHRYVAGKVAEILDKCIEDINTITVHLGNGCSIAAVQGGKSIDTSMGFTPLEGLIMGTRSGDIDPAIISFLMHREKISVDEVTDLLNKKSGLLGMSGVSNDMRDILDAVENGNKRAKLAYDVFVYRIKKYIGAYCAVLGNVDAVVFTAGIGENVPKIKDDIQHQLRFLLGDKTKFMIIKTNEEFLIAKDVYEVISKTID